MMKKINLIIAAIILAASANLMAVMVQTDTYNAPLRQDAYVDSVQTTAIFNTTALQSRGYGGEYNSLYPEINSEQRTFLMFDVSWLRDKTIISAEFGIYLNEFSPYSEPSMKLFETQDTWSETDLTWNNSLALSTSEIGFGEQIDYLRYYKWNNLKDAVRDNMEDGLISLKLAVVDEGFSNFTYFNSKESQANIPYLHIEYVVPEPATLLTLSLGAIAALRRKR